MTDKEAYKLIGETAEQLAKEPKIQEKMLEMIHNGYSKEDVEKWVYLTAIAALCGAVN